jgi:hypothetical protein
LFSHFVIPGKEKPMSFRKTCFKISINLTAICLAVAANGAAVSAEEPKTIPARTIPTALPADEGGTAIAVPPSPPETSKWPVSYEDAIKIASEYITPETVAHAKYFASQVGWGGSAGDSHTAWEVVFIAQRLTREDLARKTPAAGNLETDYLYGTITVRIDGQTGAFISKTVYFTTGRIPSVVTPPDPANPPDRITGTPAGTGTAQPGKVAPANDLPLRTNFPMPVITAADVSPIKEDVIGPGAVPQPADGIIAPYAAPDGASHELAGAPAATRDSARAPSCWLAAVTGALVLAAGGCYTLVRLRASGREKSTGGDGGD